VRKRSDSRLDDALRDPKVSAWHDSIKLRSPLTADVNVRNLSLLCERLSLSPEQAVELARVDPDRLGEVLVGYAARLKREHRLDSYIAKTLASLRSWLRYRRISFDRYPALRVVQGQSIREETPPTQEQLGRILSVLSARGRCFALLMAHAGLRPGVLATNGRSRALQLGDLPELDLNAPEPTLTKIPFLIRVPAELSKTSREYVTFGTSQVAESLVAYLMERKHQGERLDAASPVIAVTPGQAANHFRRAGAATPFVTTETLTFDLRDAMRRVAPDGTRWRPYVLRAYCSSRLLSAENAGRVSRDVREAILGHDLGVSGRYNLSKKLHPDTIEEMRQAYDRASEFLVAGASNGSKQTELDSRSLRVILLAMGYSEGEVARALADADETRVIEMIRGQRSADVPKQRSVQNAEVDALLAQGWEFVSQLGPDRAIVRPPTPAHGGPRP
jgi:integrase